MKTIRECFCASFGRLFDKEKKKTNKIPNAVRTIRYENVLYTVRKLLHLQKEKETRSIFE